MSSVGCTQQCTLFRTCQCLLIRNVVTGHQFIPPHRRDIHCTFYNHQKSLNSSLLTTVYLRPSSSIQSAPHACLHPIPRKNIWKTPSMLCYTWRGYEYAELLYASLLNQSKGILQCIMQNAKMRIRVSDQCRTCPSRSSSSRMYFTNVFLWVCFALEWVLGKERRGEEKRGWDIGNREGLPFQRNALLASRRRSGDRVSRNTRRRGPLVSGCLVLAVPKGYQQRASSRGSWGGIPDRYTVWNQWDQNILHHPSRPS